jgi:hypothetical protein
LPKRGEHPEISTSVDDPKTVARWAGETTFHAAWATEGDIHGQSKITAVANFKPIVRIAFIMFLEIG